MGESVSKKSYKAAQLEAYRLDKNSMLLKEKLKSLTEKLHSLFQLSGVDSIVKQSLLHQEGPTTASVWKELVR